jgi:hypothetical protein
MNSKKHFLNESQKKIMINILSTLIYNTSADLKNKLKINKPILGDYAYNLMLNGDNYVHNQTGNNSYKYRFISELDGRWCLKTIIFYHETKTFKVTCSEREEMLAI